MPPLTPFMVFTVFIFAVSMVLAIVGLLLVLGMVIKNEWRRK